jgi:hypothetical protein
MFFVSFWLYGAFICIDAAVILPEAVTVLLFLTALFGCSMAWVLRISASRDVVRGIVAGLDINNANHRQLILAVRLGLPRAATDVYYRDAVLTGLLVMGVYDNMRLPAAAGVRIIGVLGAVGAPPLVPGVIATRELNVSVGTVVPLALITGGSASFFPPLFIYVCRY